MCHYFSDEVCSAKALRSTVCAIYAHACRIYKHCSVSSFKQNLTYNDDLHTACTTGHTHMHAAHTCMLYQQRMSLFFRGDTRLQRIYMLSLLRYAIHSTKRDICFLGQPHARTRITFRCLHLLIGRRVSSADLNFSRKYPFNYCECACLATIPTFLPMRRSIPFCGWTHDHADARMPLLVDCVHTNNTCDSPLHP